MHLKKGYFKYPVQGAGLRKFLIRSLAAILCISVVAIVVIWNLPQNRIGRKLEEIERHLPSNPDSALNELARIHNASQKKSRNQALHALLTTMAIDKGGEYQTSDSLAKIAYNYFNKSSDLHHKMLSQYYIGQIALTNGDYARSLPHLMQAAEIADKLNDNLNAGLSYRTIGDIYFDNKIGVMSLKNFELSLDRFEKCGDDFKVYADYSKLMIMYSLLHTSDYKKAYQMADSLQKIKVPELESWDRTCYLTKATALFGMNRQKEALGPLRQIKNLLDDSDLSTDETRLLSMAYMANNMRDSARYYSDLTLKLNPTDREPEYWIAWYDKDYKKALKEVRGVLEYQNQFIDNFSSTILPNIEVEYEQQRFELYKKIVKSKQILFVSFTVIIILAILIGMLFYRNLATKRKLKIARSLMAIQEIQSLLDEKERQLDEKSKTLDKYVILSSEKSKKLREVSKTLETYECDNASMSRKIDEYKSALATLFIQKNSIWEELLRLNMHFNSKDKKILERLQKGLDAMRDSSFILHNVGNELNAQFDGLLADFEEEFKPNPNLRLLFIYLSMGFSADTISILMNRDSNWVYVNKHRLKKAVNLSSSPRKSEYLKMIDR